MLVVLNSQRQSPLDRQEDGSLLVHSIFRTIQGEGPFAGHAALFVRLYGCNLQCPNCDTDYTSKQERTHPHQLLDIIRSFYDWEQGLIVITGGEPMRQNLVPFVCLLLEQDYGTEPAYRVQIETNGTLYIEELPWDHYRFTVVCSPKTGLIHPGLKAKVHAYKYVLSRDGVHPDGLPIHALNHPLGRFNTVARPPENYRGPVYLQPMDAKDELENSLNVNAVVDSVMKHKRYIMGVQMHKLTGLP